MELIRPAEPIEVHKTIAFAKSVDPDKGFSAVLSRVEEDDAEGDRFVAGAFDDWLAETEKFPFLREHDKLKIIGQWKKPRMDKNALKADAEMLDGERYDDAKMASNLIRDGIVDGISIGAWIHEYAWGEGMSWIIHRAEVFEASLVLWPAMETARIENSRVRRMARDAHKTASRSRVFVRRGESLIERVRAGLSR